MIKDGRWREIDRLARQQGWRIEECGSGHLRYRAPEGNGIVIRSRSPSARNASRQFLADMRRHGLVTHQPRKTRARVPNPDVEVGASQRAMRAHASMSICAESGGAATRTPPANPMEMMNMNTDTALKDMRSTSNGSSGSAQPAAFHTALRREREASRLSRKELAEMLKRSANTIAVWEIASAVPGAASYAKICEVYPALREADPPRMRERSKGRSHAFKRGAASQKTTANDATEAELLGAAMQFLLRARLASWRPEVVSFLDVANTARLSLSDVLRLLQ